MDKDLDKDLEDSMAEITTAKENIGKKRMKKNVQETYGTTLNTSTFTS